MPITRQMPKATDLREVDRPEPEHEEADMEIAWMPFAEAVDAVLRRRALFARLVQADGLHDQGYATKEDFLRVTNACVQAKREMFGALRRRLAVLKEETAQAVRPYGEAPAREPPAPAPAPGPAPEQVGSAGWWPWAA